jgi:pimeloyl-ACP methyl ester carboxylesterase
MKSAAETARGSTAPTAQAQAAFLEMVASEQEELFGRSAEQAAAIASFGDIPLTVIASTRPNPDFGDSAVAFQESWIERSAALAQKSTAGAFVRAEGSSHHVHLDAPQLVLESILSIAKATGSPRP